MGTRLPGPPPNPPRRRDFNPRMWRGCGLFVNIYALVWTCYLTVFLPFPTSLPVAGTNMNYSSPIYAFVVVCALAGWFAWGKRNWRGLNMSAIKYVQKES